MEAELTRATLLPRNAFPRTGLAELDPLLSLSGGLVTMRFPSARVAAPILARLLARSVTPEKKTLYLHWLDYHDRYWSVDFDGIVAEAKRAGVSTETLSQNLLLMRFFSRDAAEAAENWDRVLSLPYELNLAVLDSARDLYRVERRAHAKSFVYSLGMFSRLCIGKECVGVVLDYSPEPLDNWLGALSSVVLEFSRAGALFADVRKHSFRAEGVVEVPTSPQRTLYGWLA